MVENRAVARLIKSFCDRLAIDPVRANEQGRYHFVIDGMPIDCFCVGDNFFIDGVILASLPQKSERLDMLKPLLHMRLLHSKIQEALYLDEEKQQIGLYRKLSTASLSALLLENAMEQFVNTLEHLTCCNTAHSGSLPQTDIMVKL